MASNVPREPETQDEPSLSSKIDAQREKLQDIIAPGFGLTVKLYCCKVLTSHQKSLINAKETTFDKNKLLLDFVLNSRKCEEFVQALWECGQTHVANWIAGNGVYTPQFGLDWPLGEKELEFLRINLENLIEVLDTEHGFLDRLLSTKVINAKQKEYIMKKSTSFDCNEAFLEILNQSSLKAYHLTTLCLRGSNQESISELFEKGGVIVPVHSDQGRNNVEEVEQYIVNEMVKWCVENKPLLRNIDANRVLEMLIPKLNAVKLGESIILFVSCYTIEEYQHVCAMVDNYELRKILEKLFSLLVHNLQIKILLVTISNSDRKNAENYFKRESLRDKKYDEHFERLRSQLKYEPMEVTTGESAEEIEEKERPEKSEDPNTSASIEDELMKVTTGESIKKSDGKELPHESDDPSTSASVEGDRDAGDLVDRLIGQSETLHDRLDVDFGLLDKLVSCRVLTNKTLSKIRSAATTIDRSVQLLEHVTSPDKCRQFIECLRRSNQTHLVNYVTSSGVYDPVFGDEWPLSDAELERLDVNREALIDTIDTVDLLGLLIAKQVLNHRHSHFIASKQTPYEKNDALLDIVRRCSLAQYKKFIECLRLSNQAHLAEILSSQVAVGIHCRIVKLRTTPDDSCDVTTAAGSDEDEDYEDENEIIKEIENLLAKMNEAKSRRILAKLQLRLFAVKKCNSICLYFLCEKLSELSLLHNLLRSGGLKTAVETLFNQILSAKRGTRRFIAVDLSYKSKDSYNRCKKFLESESGIRAGLSPRKLNLLKVNRDFLVKFLGVEDLVESLLSAGVMDESQAENVVSSTTSDKKCEQFLDVFETKSSVDYRKLVECLRKNSKGDIADVLQYGGAVARVEVTISGPNERQTSAAIVNEISVRLRNKTSSGYTQLSELTRLKLVAAAAASESGSTVDQHRVELFFHLSTLEDLQHLYELVESEELKTFAESVFSSILPPTKETRRRIRQLRWDGTDYERIQRYMIAEAASKDFRRTISQSTEIGNATIDDLPTVILDSIIRKSLLIHFCCPNKRVKGGGGEAGGGGGGGGGVLEKESVLCLSSVNGLWFLIIKRKQFKRTLERRIREFYKRVMSKVILLRNNWDFLLENTKVRSSMSEFLQAGSLSDVEMRFMKVKGIKEIKQDDQFMNLMRSNAYVTSCSSPSSPPPAPPPPSSASSSSSSSVPDLYRNFLRSLRKGNRVDMFNLLEKGGVIVDIRIVQTGEDGFTRRKNRDQCRKIAEKLNAVIERRKLSCVSAHRLLEDEGIGLTGFSVDREIVARFCCKRRSSLGRLEELLWSGQLGKMLDEDFRRLPSSSVVSLHGITDFKLSADREAFCKESVTLRPTATLLTTLDTQNRWISGVTCLKSESESRIYVLCHSPCAILVFDHHPKILPFRIRNEVQKNEIRQPSDIAASDHSSCLYVTDSGGGVVCPNVERAADVEVEVEQPPVIWKISPTTFEAVRWLTGIEKPSTLAVTGDGRVLVLRWAPERPVMETYSPDARRIGVMSFPSTVEYPRHAVETPSGIWIACYWVRIEKIWRVCEVEVIPGVKEQAGEERGIVLTTARDFDLTELKKPLNHAYYLTLDEHQRAITADFSNDRVVLCDPHFRYSQILLTETEHGVVAPRRVHYHLDSRQLLVVHGGHGFRELRNALGGRFVDVYKIC